ncbi:MAG: hypothetical protein ABIG63_21490 [Chloroflexota bacterium]
MNIFSRIRERIGAVIAALIGSVALLGCGLLFALVLAPQQKLEARRIEAMLLMDAGAVTAASAGDDILITGRLEDNPLVDEAGFVAYELEEWVVTLPDSENADDDPDGSWETVEHVVPDLSLNVGGEVVLILSANEATLSGPLHEELLYSEAYEEAKYNNEWLPDGSRRYRGFYNGDLTTVLGKKASAGGVIPDELYAGDRVAFVESQHEAAKGMLIAGIAMLVCSPVVLVGGGLAAVFGRRR